MDFLALVGMWWLMMAAMMLPVSLPWFRTLGRLAGPEDGALLRFGLGYFGVWLLYSVGAAGVQAAVGGTHALHGAKPALAGGLLLVAGLYQLSPLKASCLRHCRSPMAFFLSRWDDGPTGTLRLGIEHGVYCVGCCWALMLLGLATGTMSLAWMAILTGVVIVENLSKHGRTASRVIGVALVLLSFGACGESDPLACSDEFRYGVTVEVTDAVTGAPVPEARGLLTDGTFEEEMEAFGEGRMVGAGERPGTYRIEITAEGYEPWIRTGVELGFDGCHVIAQSFDVALAPL